MLKKEIANKFLIERKELLNIIKDKNFDEIKEIFKDEIIRIDELDEYIDLNFGCATYTIFKSKHNKKNVIDEHFELYDDIKSEFSGTFSLEKIESFILNQ